VPAVFNALYDMDIVEEESFLAWNEKVGFALLLTDSSHPGLLALLFVATV